MTRLNRLISLLLPALLALPTLSAGGPVGFGIDLKDLDREKSSGPSRTGKRKVQKRKKESWAKQREQASTLPASAPAVPAPPLSSPVASPARAALPSAGGHASLANIEPAAASAAAPSTITALTSASAQSPSAKVESRPAPVKAAPPPVIEAVSGPGKASVSLASGPAPAPAAAPTPNPAATPGPASSRVPIPAATPPAVPAPAGSAAIQPPTWICSVNGKEPGAVVDSILNALSIPVGRKILHSKETDLVPFSILVDRYFDYRGGRYVVSIGKNDPYSQNLMTLLEEAGYRVLKLRAVEDFESVGEKLLVFVGMAPDFGRHELQGGRVSPGFLVRQDDAGRRVLITREPADQNQQWVLSSGCVR